MILLLLAFLLLPVSAMATTLSDAAASMSPGTWSQLTGTNAGLLSTQWPVGYGHGFDDGNMAWNSHKRKIFHTAGDHGPNINCSSFPTNPGICWKALSSYDDATNTWSLGGAIPPTVTAWHGYDMFTYDDANEVIYIQEFGSRRLFRYCVNNFPTHCVGIQGTWTQLPLAPATCCNIPALTYHESLNGGTLLQYAGDGNGSGCGRLHGFREATGTWTDIDAGAGCKFNSGDYNNLAEFSHAKQVAIFGGGGANVPINNAKHLWKVDANGTVTQLTDAPWPISFGATYQRIAIADPVTGDFIFIFGFSNNGTSTTNVELWKLNPDGAGTWTALDADLKGSGKPCNTAFIHPCPNDLFGTAISTYGVLLFWKYTGATTAEVWLYKVTDDFEIRCQAAGVLRCVGFDSASDIANTLFGANTGIDTSGTSTPVLDTTIKASRASALKFTIPSNSGANSSGAYWANFSTDLATQFGENSDFYIQWRQRFSTEFITTAYTGGGGWKQTIIGTGDKTGCTTSTTTNCYSSCTALETVTQNTNHREFAQMYNSCTGSTSHGAFDGFNEPYNSGDFKLQNARLAPLCLYSQAPNFFPPNGNCVAYFANEWMTFQVQITTGPRVNDEFTNSYVRLWIAREGQSSTQVITWGPYNLSAGSGAENQKFGKVWLLPYNTGKDAAQVHPTAYTWYDELIISTQKIADPGASTAVSGSGAGGLTKIGGRAIGGQ